MHLAKQIGAVAHGHASALKGFERRQAGIENEAHLFKGFGRHAVSGSVPSDDSKGDVRRDDERACLANPVGGCRFDEVSMLDSNGRRFIPDLLSRLTPALAHIVRRVMSPSAERICGKGKSGHSSHPRPRATPHVTETIARILTINDGCSAVGFVASEDESVGSTTKCRRSDPNVGGRTRKALTT